MDTISLITLIGILWAAITWLLALSYVLGGYAARQRATEKDQAKTDGTIQRIFERLDRLTEEMPRCCIKSVELAEISQRLISLERQAV